VFHFFHHRVAELTSFTTTQIKRELQDQLEAVEKEIELYGGVKVEEEEQKRITAECMRKIGGKVVVIEDD
jgi:hypothetical protein